MALPPKPFYLTEPVEIAPSPLSALITLGILNHLGNKATFAITGDGSVPAARKSLTSSQGRTPL